MEYFKATVYKKVYALLCVKFSRQWCGIVLCFSLYYVYIARPKCRTNTKLTRSYAEHVKRFTD